MALRLSVFVLAVAVVILAVPAVRHLREQPPPPPPILRLTLGAPPDTELGSGDEALDAAISPDERQIVFVATRNGTAMLWRRTLESDAAQPIDGTEGARLPAWSPDGSSVAFFAGGQLRRVPVAGGNATPLAEAPSPAGVAWLADGSLLFTPQANGNIRRLRDGATTDATTLGPGERAHVFPTSAAPIGSFAYTSVADSGRRTVRLVRDDGEHDLTTTSGHGQIAADVLLHVRDGALLTQRVDPGTGTLLGRALAALNDVGVSTSGHALFVASPRVLLSSSSSMRARELTWYDLSGQRTGMAGDAGDYWQVRLSPDDRDAAVTITAPLLRTLDVWIVPTNGRRDVEPLTLALAADSDPVWSSDGRTIAYRSLQSGRPALFTRRTHDRDASETRLGGEEIEGTPSDWRGRAITFHARDQASGYDIWSLDPSTLMRTAVVTDAFNETDGRWSPDGRWLAYVSDEPGHPEIYARNSTGTRVRVSFAGGSRPRWGRDGRSLFFQRGTSLVRSTLEDTSAPRFSPAVEVVTAADVRDFDVAHSRDALIAIVPVRTAVSVPVSAIVDWQSALPPATP